MKHQKLLCQLLHLNVWCKLFLESQKEICPQHSHHNLCSQGVTNLLPLVVGSIPHKEICKYHLQFLMEKTSLLSILHVINSPPTIKRVLLLKELDGSASIELPKRESLRPNLTNHNLFMKHAKPLIH